MRYLSAALAGCGLWEMAVSVCLYFAFMCKTIAHNVCMCKQKMIACNKAMNLAVSILIQAALLLSIFALYCLTEGTVQRKSLISFTEDGISVALLPACPG